MKKMKKTKDPRRQEWGTPEWLFRPLNEVYPFTVDAAATCDNTKCVKFWTPKENGLIQSWRQETVWLNPPYSNIQPWVDKAIAEAGEICMLLPSRTDTQWFHDLLNVEEPCFRDGTKMFSVFFLRKRISFVPPEGIPLSSPNERSLIVCNGEATERVRGVLEKLELL